MFGAAVKKLIIVTGDKETIYAELLSSLISLKDDDKENDKIVGTRDGSVEAVIWNEKIYNDNKPTLGSNSKIIFIGKNNPSEPIIPSVRFNKEMKIFGIRSGSIGNKAVIYIEPDNLIKNKDLYDNFFTKYIEMTKQFDNSVADTESIEKAKHPGREAAAGTAGGAAAGFLVGGVVGGLLGGAIGDLTAKKDLHTKIPDQMFRYAILSFYLNELAEFMEIE